MKNISDNEVLYTFRSIFFRSAIYAVSAYYISISLEKILVIAGAAINSFAIEIDYQEIIINANPADWDQESVILIYLFPYIFQALIAVTLYINFQNRLSKPGYLKIFTLWIMFFISYRLLGMLPVHLYFKTGIYHAFNWLYLGLTWKIIISVLATIFYFVAAIKILNVIFFLSATYNNSNKVIGVLRISYSALLLPALLCIAVAAAFFLPGLPENELAGLIFLFLPVSIVTLRIFFANPEFLSSRIRIDDKYHPFWLFILLLVIIFVLRIILGLNISLN